MATQGRPDSVNWNQHRIPGHENNQVTIKITSAVFSMFGLVRLRLNFVFVDNN